MVVLILQCLHVGIELSVLRHHWEYSEVATFVFKFTSVFVVQILKTCLLSLFNGGPFYACQAIIVLKSDLV